MNRMNTLMAEYWENMQKIMAERKASGEYVEPKYQCKTCKDTGYIFYEKDGEQFSRPCQCELKRRNLLRLKKCGLDRLAKTCTFDSFRAETAYQIAMKTKAEAYVKNGREKWLVVVGQTGAGKTHICTAACVALIESGAGVRYFRWREDGARLKRYANMPSEYDEMIQPLKTCDVLYVDDLFKQMGGKPPTEGDFNLAFELLNHRYNRRLMTIISSEKDMHDLRAIDSALAGRIEEMSEGYYVDINPDEKRNFRRRP